MNCEQILGLMFECQNPINRLTAMCKAKHFLYGENHIEFKFANSIAKVNKVKVNHVKFVREQDNAVWKVVFGRIKQVKMFGVSMPEYEEVQVLENVNTYQVKEIFEQTTGFYTSL